MKKAVSVLLLICSMTCFIFTGCTKDAETYVVKQALIDVKGDCILLDINDKTLTDYPHVANGIDSVGDKIIIKENEVMFSGKDTKGVIGTITDNDDNIQFADVPTLLLKALNS